MRYAWILLVPFLLLAGCSSSNCSPLENGQAAVIPKYAQLDKFWVETYDNGKALDFYPIPSDEWRNTSWLLLAENDDAWVLVNGRLQKVNLCLPPEEGISVLVPYYSLGDSND